MYKSKINVSIGKIPFILSISKSSDIHVARKCHHQELPVSIIGMGPGRNRKIPRKYIPKQNKVGDVILGWAHFAYMRAPLRSRFASEIAQWGCLGSWSYVGGGCVSGVEVGAGCYFLTLN
jgi:hypothetical protein